MSRAGVGCRVTIDGQQLDDGCIDWTSPPVGAIGPGLTIDDGLKITWGRSTVLDQPSPSSCTFSTTDDPRGGVSYITALRIGARVDVYGDPDPGPPPSPEGTFTDGGFDVGVNGFPSGGTLDWSDLRAASGTHAARAIGASDPASPWSAVLAPGALQPAGTNPGAWDYIPKTSRNADEWTIDLDVYVADGVTVTMRVAMFSGPYQNAVTIDSRILATTTPGTGWQHLHADYVAATGAVWLGIQLQGTSGLTWDAVPPALTWDAVDPDRVWDDFAAFDVDNVAMFAPVSAEASPVLAFSGRITDLEVGYDNAAGAPFAKVTASDFLADLGNRAIGDEPWAAESLSARVTRILGLATIPGEQPIAADIAPSVAGIVMSWHDVDHQPAANLLTDLAQSVDGVLWSATHIVSGPFLRIEDPAMRRSMSQLALQNGMIVITTADPGEALDLSACDMLRDPVEFQIDVGDIGTRVRVEWLEQILDNDGNPATASHTEIVIAQAREDVYGTRAVSVSTMLTTAAEAQDVAENILSRTGGDWRVVGITVDDAEFAVPDAVAAHTQLQLLNGVLRGGLPIFITEMPNWTPVSNPLSAYVEGGEYTFTNGGWALALIASRATGLGQSAQWDQLDPAWTWNQWDPNITWNDLHGAAGP